MVRVSIVLVTHAQQERHIPRVHTEHVVQLVNTQLFHFGRIPILHTLLRKSKIFQILGHISISKNFKDVARLIAVVNPSLIRLHGVPEITKGHRSRTIQGRNRNVFGSISAQVANVRAKNQGHVFGISQTGLVIDTVHFARFLVLQQHLVKAIQGVGISVCPARILARLTHAVSAPSHPATMEESNRSFLRNANLRIFNRIIQVIHLVSFFISGIMESNSSNGQVIVRFIVTVVSSTAPTIGLRIVLIRLAPIIGSRSKAFFLEFQVLGKVVHFLGNNQAAVGKILIVFSIILTQDGKTGSNLTRNIRAQFTQADITFMRTSTASQCSRQSILVFGSTPPTVVGTKVTHRNSHVINHTICKVVGSHKEVCTMLGFAQNIGDTVGILGFAHIVVIVVFVTFRARGSHHRKHHKSVSLGLRFLKMVTAVVPTALQGTFLRSKARNIIFSIHKLTGTILGMARLMEPGFRITRTIDAIEFKGGITNHGINLVTNNKGRRILVEYLNTVAGIHLKPRRMGQITNTYSTRRAFGLCRITSLICGCSISTSLDRPARSSRQTGGSKRSSLEHGISFQIDYRIRFGASSIRHIVELHFGIFGQVTSLVNTDTTDTQVLRVTESLVQSIRNDSVRNKVLRHRSHLGNRIMLFLIRSVLAKAFYGTPHIGSRSIPFHRPDGTNQVIRRGLFLLHSK